MGVGRLPTVALDDEGETTWISIPTDLLIPYDDNPISAVVSSTYPDIVNSCDDIAYLSELCILYPTNDVVYDINVDVIDMIPGEMHEIFPKAFIGTIDMTPTDSSWPFPFKRRQFPTKVRFAMKINKSQG
ncbi:hypothetical protein L1887_17422 [Cichorium endivia]|nr:hypothetical protein L1887_17422 [Cichorium endivia]